MKWLSVHGVALAGAMVVAGMTSLLVAAPVTAALFVILEPDHGPPGTEVTGRTPSSGAFAGLSEPMPTYLVTRAAVDAVTNPDDAALIEIGDLIVGADGNGRMSFVVPQVDPGDYVVMAFCAACAPTSAGRTMLPIAEFQVTSSAPNTETATATITDSRATVSNSVPLLVVLATAIAMGVGYRRFAR